MSTSPTSLFSRERTFPQEFEGDEILASGDYHRTAALANPNKIMTGKVVPFLEQQGVKRVLDYGCGRFLRDSAYLAKRGMAVDAVDLDAQVARIIAERREGVRALRSLSHSILSDEYDAALLNFVITVLPEEAQRKKMLSDVSERVRSGGYLVASVRSRADMLLHAGKNARPYKDGFLIGRNDGTTTFHKGYDHCEFLDLLESVSLRPLNFYSSFTAFVCVAQK